MRIDLLEITILTINLKKIKVTNKKAIVFSIFSIAFILFLVSVMFYEMYFRDNLPTNSQKKIDQHDKNFGNFGLNNVLPKGNGTWGAGVQSSGGGGGGE